MRKHDDEVLCSEDSNNEIIANSIKAFNPVVLGPTLEYLAGTDKQMIHNACYAKKVMNKDISLLIIGETGTGKDVFARAVHQASDRASKPFVALNCASIPESLIESELFGYKRGAFTGANSKGMQGKILQSHGGTLFLDEIGDMPLNLQTRLLRVLAEKEIMPLGCESPIKVDLHVICATLRNLEEFVCNGCFREDLYYRLNGFTITLPPFRERQDKALLIEKVFATEAEKEQPVGINIEAFEMLMDYSWPGNIRQLRNALRYACAVNETGVIGSADLPLEVIQSPTLSISSTKEDITGNGESMDTDSIQFAECTTIRNVLKKQKWNISNAAKGLCISRATMYRKMKKYNIFSPNGL
ncbi:MAG: sigma 54-interacting transcriptional regulator [Geobacteraceae bacterium]|nr:sigma 54-interacting transcriptional regulator [Geobacteraceae bacterium]